MYKRQGVDKIEKQHAQGKMTARERIGMLLDKGTSVSYTHLDVYKRQVHVWSDMTTSPMFFSGESETVHRACLLYTSFSNG